LSESLQPKKARDKAARIAELTAAAEALFGEKGFASTSSQEIAALAGCSESLVYRYFGDKRGLLSALVDQRLNNLVDATLKRPLAADVRAEIANEIYTVSAWYGEISNWLRITVGQSLVDESFAGRSDDYNRFRIANISRRLAQILGPSRAERVHLDSVATLIISVTWMLGFHYRILWNRDVKEVNQQTMHIIDLVATAIDEQARMVVSDESQAEPLAALTSMMLRT